MAQSQRRHLKISIAVRTPRPPSIVVDLGSHKALLFSWARIPKSLLSLGEYNCATRWRAVGSHVSAKPLRIEWWTLSFQENNMGLYCQLYLTLYKQQRIPRLRPFLKRLILKLIRYYNHCEIDLSIGTIVRSLF